MNYKISGLLSIVFVFISIIIANYQLFLSSVVLGMLYTACLPFALLSVFYFYCRKCPHVSEKTCRHVIIGPLVEKLFKPAHPSPYTISEVLIALTPLGVLLLFPQYWLLQYSPHLIAFWICMIIAGLLIRRGVCPQCKNTYCSLCPNLSKPDTRSPIESNPAKPDEQPF